MAVARASLLKPLMEKPLTINQRAVVIGGGEAGPNAALNLGDQGLRPSLERTISSAATPATSTTAIEGMEGGGLSHSLIDRRSPTTRSRGWWATKATKATSPRKVGPGMYERKIGHGVTVVATGAYEDVPKEFLYGQHHPGHDPT